MIFNGYDDDTLVSIGLSQEEIDRERQADRRLQSSVRETCHTDWSAVIKDWQKEKKRLLKEIDQLNKELNVVKKPAEGETKGQPFGWKHFLAKAQDEYTNAWKELLDPSSCDDDWQEVVSILRNLKKRVNFCQNEVDCCNKNILQIKYDIEIIDTWIDWAKSEKACSNRIRKWSEMTALGCSLGDVIDGCRVTRGSKRPMARADGSKYGQR